MLKIDTPVSLISMKLIKQYNLLIYDEKFIGD